MTIHDFVAYNVTEAVKRVRDLLSAGVHFMSFWYLTLQSSSHFLMRTVKLRSRANSELRPT
jgi:hypothetical protein